MGTAGNWMYIIIYKGEREAAKEKDLFKSSEKQKMKEEQLAEKHRGGRKKNLESRKIQGSNLLRIWSSGVKSKTEAGKIKVMRKY